MALSELGRIQTNWVCTTPRLITTCSGSATQSISQQLPAYSSVQYPHMFAFSDMDRSAMSPPAYSFYALELPPAYEEAIKMAKPSGEVNTSVAGPKLEDISEHDGPEEEPEQQQASSNDTDSPPHYEETEITQLQVH